MAAVAILLGAPRTMATATLVTAGAGASGSGAQISAMCATLITADGPTSRTYALARSGVTARGIEDGRSVSIDRDDKKLKVYLEYTKMRALAFITRRYPSATSVTQAECASTLFTNTLRPKALHLLTVAPRGAHR